MIDYDKTNCKGHIILGQKSELATKEDISVVNDLVDTLRANLKDCVGMAANMIGIKKRILVFSVGEIIVSMINPVILKKENSYETEESCLSLNGFKKTTRYEKIEVEYWSYVNILDTKSQTFLCYTSS